MKKFEKLSAFIECSTGSTPLVSSVKRYIDVLSGMGYDRLYLGCTDAYKIAGEPYFNYKRGGYTTEDFREMDDYAAKRGIELVASVQVLGHLHFLKKHDVYRDLFDTAHILMVGDEKVYELVDKMLGAISAGLRSRCIHLGFDEAYGLGQGRYLQEHGYRPARELLLEHLERVAKIAEKYGYECEIWSDMLTQAADAAEEAASRIPPNVSLTLWEYVQTDEDALSALIDKSRAAGRGFAYAGAATKTCGFGPSNHASICRLTAQMRACERKGVKRFIVTMWSDGGGLCSYFAVLPALYMAAEYACGRAESEEDADREKFRRIAKAGYAEMKSLDYLNDPFEKNLTTLNSRSYWILFGDLLMCSYDGFCSAGTGAAYARLAEKYEKTDGGEYAHLFRTAAALCRVLAIKAELGVKLRAAIRAGDRAAAGAMLGDLDALIARLNEFITLFAESWRREYFVFGLEVPQLFLGGERARLEYVRGRVCAFAERGERVEECEGEELPPCVIPATDEDRCLEMNYRNLISFCGI